VPMSKYLISSFLITSQLFVFAGNPPVKYGSKAIPLSVSHSYFQKHTSPQFWTLIPYYVPQADESACSVASVAMIVNAARVGKKLSTEDQLVTQKELVQKVKNSAWKKSGLMTAGVTLDQLGTLVEESLKSYGIIPKKIEVVHTENRSESTQKKLHEALLEMQNNPKEFMIANFLQGAYTSDGDYGHIAPIGAFDSELKRVLVLDPDRSWYEPYWISEETFLQGMASQDKQSDQSRGYVRITLP
jgi:hypothetical protein